MRFLSSLLLLAVLVLPLGVAAQATDTVPAFPGAKGWGATALVDSRTLPLKLHFVTDTADTGDGTLRSILADSLAADSFNIVIFRTGGRILSFGNTAFSTLKNTYIAGQTAPGGGITITEGRIRVDPIGTNSDVVIRYITMAKGTAEHIRVCGERVVLDHISSYWSSSSGGGGDNTLMTCAGDGTPVEFFGSYTLSNNLACEAHDAHATIMTLQSRINTGYRNFLCGPARRFPNMTSDSSAINQGQTGSEWLNNVMYNWRGDGGATAFTRNIIIGDVLENYYKPGPGVQTDENISYMPGIWRDGENINKQQWFHISVYWCNNRSVHNGYDRTLPCDSAWVDGGNYQELTCNRLPDNFAHPTTNACEANNNAFPTVYRRSIPMAEYIGDTAKYAYTASPITDAFIEDSVLALVGNSRGLNCDGSWTFRRSAYDSTKIQQFRDSTGLSVYINWTASRNHPDSIPIVAVPAVGTACTDTDNDGMPDEWEDLYGLNKNLATDNAGDVDGDIWLNIEEYLNGTNPNVFNNADGSELATSPPYDATWFAGSDTAFAAYRVLLRRDTLVTGGGADTIIFRRPHRDTVPLTVIYDRHPDCTLGDTAIITTQDTLVVGTDTIQALSVANIDSLASAWSKPNCTSNRLRTRKVNGFLASNQRKNPPLIPLFYERWAKPEWGVVA